MGHCAVAVTVATLMGTIAGAASARYVSALAGLRRVTSEGSSADDTLADKPIPIPGAARTSVAGGRSRSPLCCGP
jgi:hypothetical protein